MEYLDIYDANFNHIGTEERGKAHEQGLWHQAFHCWVIRPNGKMLIQMRGANVTNYPSLLDVSAAGHMQAGEKLEDCVREIKEELGLDTDYSALTYLGYYRQATDKTIHDRPFKNREFTHVFFMRDDTPLAEYHLQEEEVDGIYELDIADALAFFSDDTQTITVEGYKRTDNGLTPEKMSVKLENFTPRSKWLWLKIFIMAERYLNGEKYLAV